MAKVKLIRDKKTGHYYTEDGRYKVEKSSCGWKVYDIDPHTGSYESYPCGWGSTLSNVRSLIDEFSITDIYFLY